MADNITREVYKQYAQKIASVLNGESFYDQFKQRVESGASSVKLAKKRLIQDIAIDWIDTIEDCLPNLDTIVRNPRKFIVQEEDIVDISLARSISTESVKHLAQHTNMISKVDADGMVTPNKILNITKEESFEIYENRFIYTLLLKLKDFVTMRYDKIKKASATQDVLELDVESRFNLPKKKITYRTEYLAQLSFDEVMQLDPDTLTKIERVAKIDRIITDFLSSSFAKSMRNSAPVRPPISRTNVILKEPNFKKALTLWQFVETYQVTGGFATSDDVEDYPVDSESIERLKNMVTLNTMVFESMYDQCETDFNMEDAEFADVLRVGEMDFQKDEIDRDEFAQKLDEEKENEEEDNTQEVTPEEVEEADKVEEIEKEDVTPEQSAEEPQDETPEEDILPEEIPLEEEKEVELPPKEDFEDEEPDAEKFDQNLFDVRKLYKRPDDDKIKQAEIIKIKDAIDRCLTAYRKIKQEELEERDRQDRIRRRKEDIEKRAAAFRKQREAIATDNGEKNSVYFGIDPFSNQRAKITAKKQEEEKVEKLITKQERLELEDKDTAQIKQSIAQMEADNIEKERRNADIDRQLAAIDAVMPIYDASVVDSKVVSKKDKAVPNVNATEQQTDAEQAPAVEAVTEKTVAKATKPRKSNKKPVEIVSIERAESDRASADNATAEGSVDTDKSTKPQIRFAKAERTDVWGLSATTLNQKYSKPSDKRKNLTPVDEKKVAVGDIHLSKEDKINPYAELEELKKSAKSKKSDDGDR